MEKECSAQFIYKPSVKSEEFGSPHPLRFLVGEKAIDLKSKEITCTYCEAQSYIKILENINLDHPDTDIISTLKDLKDSLLFILYNTNWPVGE